MKFILYQSAVLVPLALPLAILLSSLMTFGSLGESFELVGIKSAGISLLRFMRPLFIVAVFVSGVAFLFSNYIIPVAYLKSRTLLSDIVYAKPAFDLKEGEFYDKINGFAIKIGSKASDSIIRDVIVYEQNNTLQDNFIIAKSGVMRVTDNKRYLEFDLKDGWRYQERGNSGTYTAQGTEYIRMGFKEYKKQFDLSSFMFAQTPDSVNRNNERVYSIRQLNKAIDSLKKENVKLQYTVDEGVYKNSLFLRYIDSTEKPGKRKVNDSLWARARTLDDIIPDSSKKLAHDRATAQVNSIKSSVDVARQILKDQSRILRKHKIEWHRKIVLSMACLILFLIGAPLGSIIRKGGLGTPLIAAIIFFMIFYFSTTMGEKLAKENTLSPFGGMWMAAFILVPVGVFLTYKAMRDSQLFNKEWYFRMGNSLRKFMGRNRQTVKL